MSVSKKSSTVTLLLMLGLLLLAACGRVEAAGPAPESRAPATPSQAALAALAKADAADGTADKVVSKCVVCSLAMDGSPDYAATYGEYAVHLCSKECREAFLKDPEGILAALK